MRKWVRSPAHNQKEEVSALFDVLLAHKDRLDTLDKRAVFVGIFGSGAVYDAQRANRAISDLTIVLREFLAYEEWKSENGGLSPRFYACRSLRKRGAEAEFERQFYLLDQESLAQPHRNAEWQHFRYRLYQEQVLWSVVHNRAAVANLDELHKSLGNYFMLENLRWSGMAQSIRTLSGTAGEAPLAGIALENAARIAPEDNPPVALMLQSLMAIREDAEEADFVRLKDLIQRYAHLFPVAESRDFYMAAINFCIRRHNQGEWAYTRAALDIYKLALEKDVLLDNGFLAKYAYNNIHALAQLLGERDWALGFLEKYRAVLLPEERDNIFRYNLAIHQFRGGAYDLALELLREVQFSEVFINLDVRRMLLRSYFELGEWLSLASLLESFGTYARRQTELGYHRESYLNLIKFTKKLQKSGGKLTTQKSNKMAEAIRNEKFVAEREWLLKVVGGK